MIVYKDILGKLKAAGYSSYRLEHEKILGLGTMTRIRRGDPVGVNTIGTICGLLNCQPGDLLEYVPDANEKGEE